MKRMFLSTITALFVATLALAAAPAMASGTNPVFYDGENLFYKDKGQPVVIVGGAASQGDKGDKGDTGAVGRDGADGKDGAAGRDGRDGIDGKDGTDGRDGRDGRDAPFDGKSYANDLAATAGIGGIELRKGAKGVTSWSAGLGAVQSQGGTGKAIAFGLHHGISDNWGVYAKVSRSIGGGRSSTAAFVGVEGQF